GEVVKGPHRERAIAGDSTLDLNHARGAEIRPGELFLARPNDFHGAPCSARQSSGFHRGVAGVLASIRRAGVRDDHANTALWQMECRSELVAIGEWPLRAGPDG